MTSQGSDTVIMTSIFKCNSFSKFTPAENGIVRIGTRLSGEAPQGSIIGHLLFIIYVNDMVLTSKYFKFIIHVYADDTTLMGNLNEFGINKELSKLSLWLKLKKLSLKVSKSKFMIFYHPREKNYYS